MKDKIIGILATLGLLTLFLLYRLAQSFLLHKKVDSFDEWINKDAAGDFQWMFVFYISFTIIHFFGFLWLIAITASIIALNFIIAYAWNLIKKRKGRR